jgi:hypothetical protein
MVKYNKEKSLFDGEAMDKGYIFLDVPMNGAIELLEWGDTVKAYFPTLYDHYLELCADSKVFVGNVIHVEDGGVKFILAFTRVSDFGEHKTTEKEIIDNTVKAVTKLKETMDKDSFIASYVLGRPHAVWTKITTFVGDSFTNWNINLLKEEVT